MSGPRGDGAEKISRPFVGLAMHRDQQAPPQRRGGALFQRGEHCGDQVGVGGDQRLKIKQQIGAGFTGGDAKPGSQQPPDPPETAAHPVDVGLRRGSAGGLWQDGSGRRRGG